MSIKVTTFGELPPKTVSLGPTRLTFDVQRSEVEQPVVTAPTALTPSAVPGVKCLSFLDVTEAELGSKLGLEGDVLRKTQHLLKSLNIEVNKPLAWLGFGVDVQGQASRLLNTRLEMLSADFMRAIPQHLSRLDTILEDVKSGINGGSWFKKSARDIWIGHEAEVSSIEKLLASVSEKLIAHSGQFRELQPALSDTVSDVQAHIWVLKYVEPILGADVDVRVRESRELSLTHSLVLLKETELLLAQDIQTIVNLSSQLNDGLYIQLARMKSWLSALPQNLNETQRFETEELLLKLKVLIKG